jgi:multiple sugar transport system substrate-binding protein
VKTWSLKTGDLPTRRSVGEDAAVVDKLDSKLPGIKTFVDNLSNVQKARPQVPAYPKISLALSEAIVSVMLGKDDPQSALDKAADTADQALAEG